MDKRTALTIAEQILDGEPAPFEVYKAIAETTEKDVFNLLAGADMLRDAAFGRSIHLCTIRNAKSGRCSEDCAFCSQSAFSESHVEVYPLVSKEKMREGAYDAAENNINRYSLVTSGKRLSKKDIVKVAEAIKELDARGTGLCASLGTLDREDFLLLRDAGMTRYHHNLEACRNYFPEICTTHTYEERIETIRAAGETGLSLCVGGLFGMGETDIHALELALAVKELEVASVPINFLTPIKGTALEGMRSLTPLRCLKIIALFRYVLPDKDILVCGGREHNLGELHPLIFYAGASGIMTGNYLTTRGRTLGQDIEMIHNLGLTLRTPRQNSKSDGSSCPATHRHPEKSRSS